MVHETGFVSSSSAAQDASVPSDGVSAEQSELDAEAGPQTAGGRWRLLQAEMDSRAYWWEVTHFSPPGHEQRGELLFYQAAVCCFMLGSGHAFVAVVEERLRQGRAAVLKAAMQLSRRLLALRGAVLARGQAPFLR